MFKGAVCSDCHRHALSVTPSVWGDCVTPLCWTFSLHDPSWFPSPTWQQGWSYDCLYFMIVGGSERRGKGHAHPRLGDSKDEMLSQTTGASIRFTNRKEDGHSLSFTQMCMPRHTLTHAHRHCLHTHQSPTHSRD